MAGSLNAKVIMARCSKHKKTFGMRIEQRGADWVRTWAFPMDERKAKREGFDENTLSGSLNADANYPGCPHCKSDGFVLCTCRKVGCDGDVNTNDFVYTCPWCNKKSATVCADNFVVSGGGY